MSVARNVLCSDGNPDKLDPPRRGSATRMTSPERIQAAFAHREGDRVPLFEISIAADTASEMLGRQALTGMTYLRYREAEAWMQGPGGAW